MINFKRKKSFYKRFFFSLNKIKRSHSFKNHNLCKKSSNLKRFLRKKFFICNSISNRFSKILF